MQIYKTRYIPVGDYFVPNWTLPEEPRSIGTWGRMHRDYLKECHPVLYSNMVLRGTLWTHLADLNEQAQQQRLEAIIDQMKAAESVTEELKARAPLAWTQQMNNIHARAKEIVLHELIFTE